MKFSTRAEYGLKALSCLARAYPSHKSLRELSDEEHIPYKYLEQLFAIFKQKGLVKSSRGKSGGYVLTKNPSRIKAGEIVEIMDGPIDPMGCNSKGCRFGQECSSSKVWIKLAKEIRKTLNSIALSDLK